MFYKFIYLNGKFLKNLNSIMEFYLRKYHYNMYLALY